MIEVPLSQGLVAFIDDADAWVLGFRWYAWLHRVILDAPAGVEVDHVDGNGLDCRRMNLRLATHAQNSANVRRRVISRSGFKGVRETPRGRWVAYIKRQQRQLYLGVFDTPEQAAAAYNVAAQEIFGEFASFNTPDDGAADPVSR